MLKLYIDSDRTSQNEIRAEGSTPDIMNQLVEAVYRLLTRLDMEESIPERIKLFHGGLQFEFLLDSDD